MLFSHAIVIDFEATCYDKLEKPPPGWRAEIVEFPAVLIDLDSGEILDEFHSRAQNWLKVDLKKKLVLSPVKVICQADRDT